jgi:pterin-4a-carbinolamine dehydratase
VASLAKVLLESERWEIQRERLALARERFQFDAAEAALAEIPRVSEMTEEEVKKEKERVQGIIRSIFGTDLPK